MSNLQLDINLIFPAKGYRQFLRKLRTFVSYCATVGIHKSEGLKKATRKYFKRVNKDSFTDMYKQYKVQNAGRSHVMTVVKLAYQNEFGTVSYGGKYPDIVIKPRYKTVRRSQRLGVYHSPRTRTTRTAHWKESVARSANEQGFLLMSRTGDFVMYKKPNETIGIPPRPFLTKVIDNPPATLANEVGLIMQKALESGGSVPKAYRDIASLVTDVAKSNIDKSPISNHPLTVKAKGFDKAYYDTQNRIYNSVKYKVYKNADKEGSAGNKALQRQMVNYFDVLLAKAKQYENLGRFDWSTTENTFRYKTFNPNYRGNYFI